MLQFNGTVYTIATRLTSRFLWRLNATLTTNTTTVASESKVNIKVKFHIFKYDYKFILCNRFFKNISIMKYFIVNKS